MAAQVTNHKCPSCMAPLHYSAVSGKLECEYCESAYSVEEIEAMYAQKEAAAETAFVEAQQQEEAEQPWDVSALQTDWGEDAAGMRAYSCPSCGAELVCDHTTAATSCPYCGNPTIVPGQFSGTLKPDCVIPFKVDKATAVAKLKQYYKGKLFLPKVFADENRIDQIKGIYVPFWLFDGQAKADMQFKATRSHRRRQGEYEVITTEHFMVQRSGTVTFEKIPVDASTKMPDAYMDAIEPFDYSALTDFSTAYLPGYLADKYDVDAASCGARADERAENTAVATMTQDAAMLYETCVPVHKNVKLIRGSVKYALLPVWMLHTKWKQQDYLFAINGQTGKMVGNLPVDWGKFWGIFAAIAVPLAAILWLLIGPGF